MQRIAAHILNPKKYTCPKRQFHPTTGPCVMSISLEVTIRGTAVRKGQPAQGPAPTSLETPCTFRRLQPSLGASTQPLAFAAQKSRSSQFNFLGESNDLHSSTFLRVKRSKHTVEDPVGAVLDKRTRSSRESEAIVEQFR